MKETVKKRLSVWHVMGAYVGSLLLLIIMNHYLLHFFHIPDTVTSALHALHFPVLTTTLWECYHYYPLFISKETEALRGYVTCSMLHSWWVVDQDLNACQPDSLGSTNGGVCWRQWLRMSALSWAQEWPSSSHLYLSSGQLLLGESIWDPRSKGMSDGVVEWGPLLQICASI